MRPGPLSLPYFWDEADVYVQGGIWLAEHGLDARPGVFPDDWSRGHPPLLYLLAGIVFRAFGAAPTVGHLLVLPFAVLALVATGLLAAELWGRRAGLAAMALLACTPLFMTMANMLLPEMPLTAGTALAFALLARGNLGAAALVGAALVLTKETGVFTAAGVTAAVGWDLWRRGGWGSWVSGPGLRQLAIASSPLAVLIAFFVWQKALAGYFVFPHHQGLLWERPFGIGDLWTVGPSLLLWHGRWIVLIAAALALLRPLPRVDETQRATWRPSREAVVVGLSALVGCNAIFFAKMFWLERYALPAHVAFVVIVAGLLLRDGLPVGRLRAGGAAIAIAAGIGLAGMWSEPGADQAELTFVYADVIATHRAAIDAVLALPERPTLVLTTWPLTEELERPEYGFTPVSIATVHVRALPDHPTARPDAVLIPSDSSHRDQLTAHAQELGLRPAGTWRVGRTPQTVALWAR